MMAGIYKENAGLAEQIESDREERLKQQELKEKHNIEDENVIVVEKPSLVKFLIKLGIRIVKVLATIIILCLATIGLLGLLYPEPREELILILESIKNETLSMFN